MDSEPKDFKAVKVQMKTNQNQGEVLSRSMLYSGINIFGQLSQIYLQSKESGQTFSAVESMGKGGASGGDGSVMNLSPEILSVFKRMQKKDPNTKTKALQELERYVESMDMNSGRLLLDQSMQSEDISSSQTQSDEMQSLLTFFLYHFCRIIINEPDKKVREAAHTTFAAFIKKAKRRLGPHLKRIFSLWYCSFFDISQEVAALARKNFENAFPENKRDQVFKMAFKNFLHFANEQLKQSEDAVSEQVAELSKAQREDVFDRITSSVLSALAKSFDFIHNWPEEDQAHFKKKLIDILDLGAHIPTQAEEEKKGASKKQQPQSYLWGFLQPKYRGRVRASCLIFISNLLLNLPTEVVSTHISQLAPLVHNLVGEDNFQLQTSLWRDAFFPLGKHFPNSWESTNIKKNFLPKFNQCLKTSAFGAPSALYENFIKFVSVFPLYYLIDYTEDKTNKASFKERCNLLRETLTTLYQGLKNDESVAYHQDLMKSYFETFSFILLKRVQPLVQSDKAPQEDKDFAILQMKKCIQLPLEDYINNFQRFNSKVQNERNIRYTIPFQMTKMLRDLAERNLDQRIYSSLIEYMNESLNLDLAKPNIIRLFHSLLKNFLPRTAPYFFENILSGLLIKYITTLQTKIVEDTENLGKENIESLTAKATSLQRTIYKLNKFTVQGGSEILLPASKAFQDVFFKIAKKEELAAKVLSHDILAKFKLLKESILKSIILLQNLSSALTSDFATFASSLLHSATLDVVSLKTKLLSPVADFKKVKFTSYFNALNDQQVHGNIIEFVTQQIIGAEANIGHTWQIVDQGLSSLSLGQSYLVKGDEKIIAKAVFDKVQELKSKDYVALQHYFSAVKSLLTVKDEQAYEPLREKLFDTLLQIKSTHPSFATLWSLYSATLKAHLQNTPFFAHCLSRLQSELHSIISSSHSTAQQFDVINRFTLIVKAFVQLLPQGSADRQRVIEEILLQESTFERLAENCLPLKMFRDLFLSGGIGGFDVTKLFESSEKYVWLAAILLNTRHLPSLANFIEMKKQLVIFVDTELIPSLINQVQCGNSSLVTQVVKYMQEQSLKNVDYVYSIESFIARLIDPGEDFPVEEKPVLKIDDFKTIFQIVYEPVKKSLQGESTEFSNSIILFLRVLRQVAYYIIDVKEVQDLYSQSREILQTHIKSGANGVSQKVAVALEIFLALDKYLAPAPSQESDDLTQSLLVILLQKQDSVSLDSNILNAILIFASSILDTLGVGAFTKILTQAKVAFQQSFLNWIFDLQQHQHLSPLTYIHLLSIVRKTLNCSDLVTDSNLLLTQVLDLAKHHALAFDMKAARVQALVTKAALSEEELDRKKGKKAVHFVGEAESEKSDEEEDDDQIEDFEQEMLQEAAETLIAFSTHVHASVSENDLYILLSTGVESLQKAAFVLLKVLYETFIPTLNYHIQDSDELSLIKQEAHDSELQAKDQEEEEKKGGDHYKHHDHENYKNKLAFKNVSEILIEILENPPAVSQDGSVHQQHVISGSTQVESLIFQDAHKESAYINNKVFGYFLAWNALLIKIENGRMKSQLTEGSQDYGQVLGALNEFLEENDGVYRMLMVLLLAHLPEEKRGLQDNFNVSTFEPEYMDLTNKHQVSLLTVYTLLNFMKSFPSLARKYCQECDKQLLELVMPYIKQLVSPAILENEIRKIEIAQLQLKASGELTFALFKSTKEILANFKKGEIEMTLKIKIPTDYPLKLVEVDVSKQLKISEKQLRKWVLSIRKIIQFQNGDIISAVLAWKSNIEREIDGVEDCYICYAVVHENDQSLPKMPCKTCKNKFHVACIRKWFRQSHKSNCPICQNYFF